MPNPLPVDISGEDITLNSQPPAAATGTPTSVAASASDVTILAANANRLGPISVYNDSTAILYLLVASGTSSSSNYTAQVNPGALYETPPGLRYTGIVKGIWAAANGSARMTEWSA